jgi:hypothetical protein
MPLMILSVYGVLDLRVLPILTHSPPTFSAVVQRSDCSCLMRHALRHIA